MECKNCSISSGDTISRLTLLHTSEHKLLLMVIISLKANLKNFNKQKEERSNKNGLVMISGWLYNIRNHTITCSEDKEASSSRLIRMG